PGPGVFEFARANDRSDYMLIEPTPACKQGHVLTERNARGVTTVRDHIDWALQLMPYDKPRAMYYEACGRGSFVAAGRYLGERTEARREHGTIISTETAEP